MAKIILGIGCAHTPQLHTPAEHWEIRAARDVRNGVAFWHKGERLQYDQVLERRRHLNLGEQTGMATRQERLQSSYAAIDRLSAIFAAAKPDAAILFGNDQGEMFLKDIKPAFTIMGAQQFENMPRTEAQIGRLPPGIALADPGHLPEDLQAYPGHPQLAEHLCREALAAGFDVSYSHAQHRADPAKAQLSGMPHAYGFIYKQIFRDLRIPHVPVDTNTFFPPNQPPAPRCHALGKAIGEAARSWDGDARVALIASGGLSHFVVDEEFDRDIIAAMQRGDFEHLLSYHEGYYQAGSSEIKSWIALGGALAGAGLTGHFINYHPLYRTPAGTGSSAAFMYWQ